VQSLPTIDDTRYLLDLADVTPSVVAVVGWVDLKAADAAAAIDALAVRPKLRGLRPMLQDLPDDAWIDDPALDGAIAAMMRRDLRFDALVLPKHLDALHAFARRYPDLPIVIDHAAKPRIDAGEREPWRSAMTRLARLPNVHCKLSGVWTEVSAASSVDEPRLRAEPYIRIIAELFSPQRIMWGSDWPVLNLATYKGHYGEWLRACEDDCARLLGSAALDDIFGGNACRFYRIGAAASLT
jgi:L-fuconolactonase